MHVGTSTSKVVRVIGSKTCLVFSKHSVTDEVDFGSSLVAPPNGVSYRARQVSAMSLKIFWDMLRQFGLDFLFNIWSSQGCGGDGVLVHCFCSLWWGLQVAKQPCHWTSKFLDAKTLVLIRHQFGRLCDHLFESFLLFRDRFLIDFNRHLLCWVLLCHSKLRWLVFLCRLSWTSDSF